MGCLRTPAAKFSDVTRFELIASGAYLSAWNAKKRPAAAVTLEFTAVTAAVCPALRVERY